MSTSYRQEQGGILVLFAIAVAAIIALIALAIDTSIYASQAAKYDRTAEHAALAALQAYLAEVSKAETDTEEALQVAVRRAEQITGANLELYFGTSLLKDKEAPLSDLAIDDSAPNGKVIPGKWHFIETEETECDRPSEPFKPCFQTVDIAEQANAIRVELQVNENSPLRVLFSGLMPGSHPVFNTSATASLIPRRGVFLIDLSTSIVHDTHRVNDIPGEDSEYSYYIDPALSATCRENWQGDIHAAVKPIFDDLPAGPRDRPEQTQHYKDEFECFTVDELEESYALDTVTEPQPLTGVLSAINTALEEFRRRGVSADLVGVVGFDDEILDVRKLDMVKPSMNEESFAEFFGATDVSRPIAERKDRFLFPRLYGGRKLVFQTYPNPTYFPLPAMTDVGLALSEAQNMIAQFPGAETSDNFIVLISDGLGNCVSEIPTGQSQKCFYSAGDPETSEFFTRQAVDEIAEFADVMRDNEIALHVLLIGDEVLPHTLVRKGEDGCLDDRSARTHPTGPVDFVNYEGGTLTTKDDIPFYYPNKIYEHARTTGGLWAPVVDCCRDEAGNCDSHAEELLQNSCRALGGEVGELFTCDCSEGADCPAVCSRGWVDPQGRLICDPEGRTKTEQVQDMMEEIMGSNPFLLVE